MVKECTICAGEFEELCFIYPCYHEFCGECIDRTCKMRDRIYDRILDSKCPICRVPFFGSFDQTRFTVLDESTMLVSEAALETGDYPTQKAEFRLGWVSDDEAALAARPKDYSRTFRDSIGTYIEPTTGERCRLSIGGRPMMRNFLVPGEEKRIMVDLGREPRLYPLAFDGRFFTCLWRSNRARPLEGVIVVDRELSWSSRVKLNYPLIIYSDRKPPAGECVRFKDGQLERAIPQASILADGDWKVSGALVFTDNRVMNPFTKKVVQLWEGARILSLDSWTCVGITIATLESGFVRLPIF